MVSIQNPADLTAPSKDFTFDSAYDPKSTTECIYNDICYPLVEVSLNIYWEFYCFILLYWSIFDLLSPKVQSVIFKWFEKKTQKE